MLVVACVLAGITIATVGYFLDWGDYEIRSSPRAANSASPTAPTRSEGERAADARFAAAGTAPITQTDRGVVDLSGTQDLTAPELGIPSVSCQNRRARVIVTADDNERVADVIGTFTQDGAAPRSLAFTATADQWVAAIDTTPGTADAVSIVARDGGGNTLTRTVTNLCT